MIKITVCIGSSCHIKGSRPVVEQLQRLIAENGVSEKVELGEYDKASAVKLATDISYNNVKEFLKL